MTRLFDTLITATELRELRAAGPAPVIVDTGFDLADTEAGERAWRSGHVPGSFYLHVDRDLSGPRPATTAAIRCRIAPRSPPHWAAWASRRQRR